MHMLNSDPFNFIGFPQSASEIIYNCADYHQRLLKLNYAKLEGITYYETGNDVYQGDPVVSVDTIRINYLNETHSSTINSNCPGLRSQSTVAHISMAVATITMLVHFIMVIIISSGLRKLYGICLSIVILFNALHSGVLFASAYMPKTIIFNLTETEIKYFVEKKLFFNCWFMDILTHYLILSIYTGIFFGLIERYRCTNHCFKRTSIFSKSWRLKSLNWSCRKQKGRDTSNEKIQNEWVAHSYATTSKVDHDDTVQKTLCDTKVRNECKTFKQLEQNLHRQERRTRFVASKDGGYEQNKGNTNIIPRLIINDASIPNNRRWNIIIIVSVLCLPLLPTSYGIWASSYLRLSSVWNPSYGIITCGNLGGCLAAHQWLMHVPIAFLCLATVILIILISIKTHTNCLIQDQFSSQPLDSNARFRMLTKIAISHTVVWIAAFISNYICHAAAWQFYGLVLALQSLYIIVSFTFSRPFLEVIFKRDDPLARLKLDNLAMQLPLGVFRSHVTVSTSTNTSSTKSFLIK
ncbi:unnamed protein product [Heterobilharzia americana]|nr:unnamed protein product [Heterobilharzia americana]